MDALIEQCLHAPLMLTSDIQGSLIKSNTRRALQANGTVAALVTAPAPLSSSAQVGSANLPIVLAATAMLMNFI